MRLVELGLFGCRVRSKQEGKEGKTLTTANVRCCREDKQEKKMIAMR